MQSAHDPEHNRDFSGSHTLRGLSYIGPLLKSTFCVVN